MISRRKALGLLAAFSLVPGISRAQGKRIAAIDWAMLETALALGASVVAATELKQFRKEAIEPSLPPDITDLGLRGSPNFELLRLMTPDIILSSPFYARNQSKFAEIGQVISLPFYVKGEPPFEKALAAVASLGKILGVEARAETLLAETNAAIDRYQTDLARFALRPTYLINIGDARHFRAFGADSMFGDVLVRLGLANAWMERSQFSFAAPVPIERLAEVPEARILIVSDIPVEAREALKNSILWNALPAVKNRRVVQLDNVNPHGGVPAAMRFARLFHVALTQHPDAL
ncbi:iron-siderophore ABC transporter substrate-binding protein [Phyllobacterium sp. P30BS-XVII]|uniref:iron-siderophore ABC transporter substrate-binding protein n=1 Tax=Phyllobacterium sp. P30BS-XVII TaxID=2587046 RepID=UPI000DD5CD62|nr:iron-siderophore ABC transporter substrate-binding protein [Phyllobacterium sp. P30BS-XVII]MBA8903881.1 iron complex transport system substrate-binding protein [Phyllobacterium sp. P30BS-XVII]